MMRIPKVGIKVGKAIANSPGNKGDFGEMIVASLFDPRFFGNEEHYIVNNIIVETNDGKTHQIDHIVIYKTGIFCIETKNIQGKIVGKDNSDIWTIIRNKKEYKMLSPILQNEGHVKALKTILDCPYEIKSLIVFIKGNKPSLISNGVLNLNELVSHVMNFPIDKELSSEEMRKVFQTIQNYKNNHNINKQTHLKNINS